MTTDACISQRGAHAFWTCPNCKRTLGEVVGVRLVIIVSRERLVNFPLHDDLQLTCPKCGQVSVYRKERRTA